MAEGGLQAASAAERRTRARSWGYRLAHAPEREVVGGFSSSVSASDALGRVLSAQQGAAGVIVGRVSDDAPWLCVGAEPWWW